MQVFPWENDRELISNTPTLQVSTAGWREAQSFYPQLAGVPSASISMGER